MFYGEGCTYCGDCFVRCLYLNYDQDEALHQIERLITSDSSEVEWLSASCTFH